MKRLFVVSFSLVTVNPANPQTYYVRKRIDRFGSWYTAKIHEAKVWQKSMYAHNWIAQRENFENRYGAVVLDVTYNTEVSWPTKKSLKS